MIASPMIVFTTRRARLLTLALTAAVALEAAAAEPQAEPLDAPIDAAEVAETLAPPPPDPEGDPAALAEPIEPLGPLADTGECGEVVIGEPAWTPARLTARVLEIVLADGYGCFVRRAPADPERALDATRRADAAMRRGPSVAAATREAAALEAETGSPDADPADPAAAAMLVEPPAIVALDVHAPEPGAEAADGPEAGRAVFSPPLYGAAAGHGWFLPEWFAEANPDIRGIADLAGAAERFAPASGARPKLYLCPAAWPCHAEDQALAAAYRLEEAFEIVTPASGEALTRSLREAWRNREPWLGSYWTPAEALAERPMRRLAAEEAAPAPRLAYPETLRRRAPKIAALLDGFALAPETLHAALAWRAARNATLEETALHLLQSEETLWRGWTPPAAQERLGAALAGRAAAQESAAPRDAAGDVIPD